MKRLWCRLFHNQLMQPVNGKACCSICQEVWDASFMDCAEQPRKAPVIPIREEAEYES